MYWYVLFSVVGALSTPVIFAKLVNALPGYYPARVAWWVVLAFTLLAVLSVLAIIFSIVRVDLRLTDAAILPLFVGFMTVVCVRWQDRIRLHAFCMQQFDAPDAPEYIELSELGDLLRTYAKLYPGVWLVVRKTEDPSLVTLEVKGRVIATLRVPDLSASAVVRGLYDSLPEPRPEIKSLELQWVGLFYDAATRQCRTTTSSSVPRQV